MSGALFSMGSLKKGQANAKAQRREETLINQ
jgi:hypothetical protein